MAFLLIGYRTLRLIYTPPTFFQQSFLQENREAPIEIHACLPIVALGVMLESQKEK